MKKTPMILETRCEDCGDPVLLTKENLCNGCDRYICNNCKREHKHDWELK